MTQSLTKLSPARLSDQAAAALKRRIADRSYGPGTRLPAEKVLAAELGVTRLTVREALSQLEAAGLTSTRHGSGTYVADIDGDATLDVRGEMLTAGRALTREEARSLMEFREVVVLGFLDQLIAGARPEHIVALRGVVEEGRRATGSPERLAALDYRFNELVARATGNQFFTLLLRSMQTMHLSLGALVFKTLADDEAILAAQQAVVDALARRARGPLEHALHTYLAGGTRIVATRHERPARRRSPAKSTGGSR